MKNKNEKCVIEAHFKMSNYDVKDFFDTNDLDYEEITILRREVLTSGKSRAFINDTPVNLQELQTLSDYLIDVHSQHHTQELSENVVLTSVDDLYNWAKLSSLWPLLFGTACCFIEFAALILPIIYCQNQCFAKKKYFAIIWIPLSNPIACRQP